MQGKFKTKEKLPEKLTMEHQLRMEEEVRRMGFERQLIEALHSEKEDCLVVLGLLRQDWSLLNDCEPELVLHLGVRRGCAELVEQVLKHLGIVITLADKSKLSTLEEEINSPSSNQGATTVVTPEHQDDAKTTQTDARSSESDNGSFQSQRDVLEGAADKGTTSPPLFDLKKNLARLGSIHDQPQARPVVDYTALLLSKHGGLDVLARAVLNGNLEVLSLLFEKRRADDQIGPYRDQLRSIAQGVVAGIKRDSVSYESCKTIFNSWRGNPEFNFLFWDFDLWKERVSEYLFHFLFTNGFKGKSLLRAELIRECLWLEVCNSPITGEQPLWKSLLRLHDAQGRTPLHVAVDEGTVSAFRDLLGAKTADHNDGEDAYRFAIRAPDGLGRTAWHRAVVLGDTNALLAMLGPWSSRFTREMLWQESMCDPLHSLRYEGILVGGIDLHEISVRNGFKGYRDSSSVTPLHSAILHQRTEILDEFATFSPFDTGFDIALASGLYRVDTLELATLMGEASTVRRLLALCMRQDMREGKVKSGRKVGYGWLSREYRRSKLPWPTIHLAASSGNFEVLKAFIDRSDMCDPYIEDLPKRTVIHHAMKVIDLSVQPHLLDYASIKHFASQDRRVPLPDDNLERQGCINLLLQTGCDMFKADVYGQAPYPKGDLTRDKEFLSWWYDKQSKEFNATQSAMISATSAISIMATLVATGAYVGPLQPPLGYSNADGPGQIQTTYLAVRIFIFCDTLSFYLASAAITFSLIPSLPMPQQPMKDELDRTRGMIIFAVATLFPSIVCILIAFASSSIIVISANGESSFGGHLTIITASIGGLICSIGFFFLFIRLLGIIFPMNRWIRIIYDWRSPFLQWRSRKI